MIYLFIYLITVNIYTFILTGVDKKRAIQGDFRVSEAKLLIPAFLFGSVGLLLGMSLFRHKTKKLKFIILSRLLILVQLVILIYVFIKL